ncbi:Cytochrome C553 (soluble cytochrome f) [hydrothermal vent metagenome]|uniref:Cytochrome C553 (Soluble cytochrome f) n=1 Tax=hydrothermal vent metagenome TaxID=652676 RepID=A0A1W1CUX6_9ZZZZ
MSKAEIETALKGYKDGSYGGAMKGVMKGQVAKLTDKDITEIATSIAGGDDNATADANKTVATDANKTKEATKK